MSGRRALRLILAVLIGIPALGGVPAHSSHAGFVTAVAIDPQTPTTIYAGTSGGGVFKTIDGGAIWSATALTDIHASGLAIDPQNPNTLYAATFGGVFKSTDGGASWSPTGLTNIDVLVIAIDPQNPYILYAGSSAGGVYKSADGGVSWSAGFPPLYGYCGPCGGVQTLAIDPLTPATLFAGTAVITMASEDGWLWTVSGIVFKSVDGGTSWESVFGGDVVFYGYAELDSVLSLAIEPRTDRLSPTTLYAGTSGGVFKSTDGGASWNATPLTGGALALAIDPQNPNTLYAGTFGGVFKSTDGGASWNATALTVGPSVLAIDPQNPSTLYAGTSGGVFKSVDGGTNWTPTGPITWLHLSSMSLNPSSVVGGIASTGILTLSTAVPAGGVVVALSSSNPAVATVPANVTVPAGATSTDFTVSTSAVTASTTVTITASYGGIVSSQLIVTPTTTLSSLSLNPASVAGGSASTGTVILSSPAPTGGAVVALYSGSPAITAVPANVTVAAGATSGTFTISTSVVATSTNVWISATNGGITHWAALTITPATTLSSVSLSPTSVTAGATSTGTVTLSAAAPAGGAVVALSSSSPAVASVPASVTVPGGATSANFTVSSVPCTSGSATISGIYGGVTRSAELTVNLPATDTIMIQQADYFGNRRELRVAAKSTGSGARLWVYVTSTREFIGELTNLGDGKYSGQFAWPANPQNVTVWSSLCGSATSVVRSK